ncbi:uncharacterized protein LOC111342864 [Stylophora pistillata]|uniref:uncharacterized protein LOC111342864 n=1 Tax=Stylophora pistillata TaxID=50429 RepID=UPI000C0534F4|nr:uncharacterized protein LOC111342864 [Stylophora pistillata]
MGEKGIGAASNFLNPLHKVNQDLMCENNREKQRDANTKLEDIITCSEPVLHGALNVKESNSMAEFSSKGLEDRVEMPMRPPPRAPLHDLKIRSRGESDPMPLDVNQMSRVLAIQQDTLHPVIESKQEDNSPRSETEKLENAIDYNKEGEDYDDNASDDDEWDSDFDDEDFDDNDEELKRDSRSSHDSSCDTEPLEFPDAISKKLYNIAMEILTTERAYVRRLHLLDQVRPKK